MTETTALVRPTEHLMPAMTIAQATTRYQSVVTFTRDLMREGVDYGIVPGSDKPTLLKPGAEKLTTFFGLTTRFELVENAEDWTGSQHDGEPFFYYWFRCRLLCGDLLIAEADGSCNSWEAKYRYRQAQRMCPTCEQPTIKRSKYPPRDNPHGEPGWYCFAKIGGCGSNFDHDAPAIVDQQVGRVPNPNPADIVNTIKKMAQKRALVAATLLAVNASEFFTQDLEDLDMGAIAADYTVSTAPPQAAKPNGSNLSRPLDAPTIQQVVRQKAGWTNGSRRTDVEPITQKQTGAVVALMATAVASNGMTQADLDKARHQILDYLFTVDSTHALTLREASALIAWLAQDTDAGKTNGWARAEASGILKQIALDAGQMELAGLDEANEENRE